MPKIIARRQELLAREAKVWIILIGVNHYLDEEIPDLNYSAIELCGLFQTKGQFEIKHFLDRYENVQENLRDCLASSTTQTILIYLEGEVEQTPEGSNLLRLGERTRIARDWLLEQLRESPIPQKIIILDCPVPTNLESWVNTLQLGIDAQQCIIAAVPREELAVNFSQILVKILSEFSTGLTALLSLACNRLRYHCVLLEAENARTAGDACLALEDQYWNNIDLNPNTLELETDPKAVAKQLAAPAIIVKQALDLAKQKKIDSAIELFQKAQKLSPEIDLNPETKEIDRDPQQVAKQFVD